MLTSTNDSHTVFALALIISEMLTCKMFDLENVGQDHNAISEVTLFDGKCQNLQRTPTHFSLALTISEILKFTFLAGANVR